MPVFWNQKEWRKRGPMCSSFAPHKAFVELRGGWGSTGSRVPCPQSTKLGPSHRILEIIPGFTPVHTGGDCTGLGSPRGQTGDGQSSQHGDNTAQRAHTDMLGGHESWSQPLGLGSRAVLSLLLETETVQREQTSIPHPVVQRPRLEDPGSR